RAWRLAGSTAAGLARAASPHGTGQPQRRPRRPRPRDGRAGHRRAGDRRRYTAAVGRGPGGRPRAARGRAGGGPPARGAGPSRAAPVGGVFYGGGDGSERVEEFIAGLPPRHQAAIDDQIDRVNALLTVARPHLPFPYSSQVDGELRELRCHYGSTLYRILY